MMNDFRYGSAQPPPGYYMTEYGPVPIGMGAGPSAFSDIASSPSEAMPLPPPPPQPAAMSLAAQQGAGVFSSPDHETLPPPPAPPPPPASTRPSITNWLPVGFSPFSDDPINVADYDQRLAGYQYEGVLASNNNPHIHLKRQEVTAQQADSTGWGVAGWLWQLGTFNHQRWAWQQANAEASNATNAVTIVLTEQLKALYCCPGTLWKTQTQERINSDIYKEIEYSIANWQQTYSSEKSNYFFCVYHWAYWNFSQTMSYHGQQLQNGPEQRQISQFRQDNLSKTLIESQKTYINNLINRKKTEYKHSIEAQIKKQCQEDLVIKELSQEQIEDLSKNIILRQSFQDKTLEQHAVSDMLATKTLARKTEAEISRHLTTINNNLKNLESYKKRIIDNLKFLPPHGLTEQQLAPLQQAVDRYAEGLIKQYLNEYSEQNSDITALIESPAQKTKLHQDLSFHIIAARLSFAKQTIEDGLQELQTPTSAQALAAYKNQLLSAYDASVYQTSSLTAVQEKIKQKADALETLYAYNAPVYASDKAKHFFSSLVKSTSEHPIPAVLADFGSACDELRDGQLKEIDNIKRLLNKIEVEMASLKKIFLSKVDNDKTLNADLKDKVREKIRNLHQEPWVHGIQVTLIQQYSSDSLTNAYLLESSSIKQQLTNNIDYERDYQQTTIKENEQTLATEAKQQLLACGNNQVHAEKIILYLEHNKHYQDQQPLLTNAFNDIVKQGTLTAATAQAMQDLQQCLSDKVSSVTTINQQFFTMMRGAPYHLEIASQVSGKFQALETELEQNPFAENWQDRLNSALDTLKSSCYDQLLAKTVADAYQAYGLDLGLQSSEVIKDKMDVDTIKSLLSAEAQNKLNGLITQALSQPVDLTQTAAVQQTLREQIKHQLELKHNLLAHQQGQQALKDFIDTFKASPSPLSGMLDKEGKNFHPALKEKIKAKFAMVDDSDPMIAQIKEALFEQAKIKNNNLSTMSEALTDKFITKAVRTKMGTCKQQMIAQFSKATNGNVDILVQELITDGTLQQAAATEITQYLDKKSDDFCKTLQKALKPHDVDPHTQQVINNLIAHISAQSLSPDVLTQYAVNQNSALKNHNQAADKAVKSAIVQYIQTRHEIIEHIGNMRQEMEKLFPTLDQATQQSLEQYINTHQKTLLEKLVDKPTETIGALLNYELQDTLNKNLSKTLMDHWVGTLVDRVYEQCPAASTADSMRRLISGGQLAHNRYYLNALKTDYANSKELSHYNNALESAIKQLTGLHTTEQNSAVSANMQQIHTDIAKALLQYKAVHYDGLYKTVTGNDANELLLGTLVPSATSATSFEFANESTLSTKYTPEQEQSIKDSDASTSSRSFRDQ